MSWNTSRILNDLEYEINENKQDISVLERKTFYISDLLGTNGTVFLNNVYSEAFVKNGGTASQYLMADGSTTTNSQQGQPNIYLYNNNNSGTPEPASGQIRANDPNNQNVTQLYISHITSDGIDIDLFLAQRTTVSGVYLQDRNNSNNNVRFNVTAPITNTPNSYVTVPVVYASAQGNGSTDFGDGHPLFMSIFDNSALVDSRISSVETKTQHQSATSLETRFNSPINMFDHKIYNVADPVDLSDVSTKNYVDTSISALDLASYTPLSEFNGLVSTVTTQGQYINELEVVTQNQSATASLTTFVDSTQLLLDTNQFFGIKSPDLLSNYLIVTPISINTYLPINMDAKELLNVSGVKISGADASNYFIKSNGTVDTNTYLQSADLSALETKTQNMSATSTITTIEKSAQFRLSNSNTFSITDDSGPFISVTKLLVTNSQINAQIPMSMNTYKLNGIPTPTNNDDAVNKIFVDNRISSLSGTYATLTQLNEVNDNANTKLSLSGGIVNGNVTLQTGDLSLQNGNLDMGSNLLLNVGTLAINDSLSIASGNSFEFLKGDGSSDPSQYLNIQGGIVSGALTNTLSFGQNFKVQDNTQQPILTVNNTEINTNRSLNVNATSINNIQNVTFSDGRGIIYRQTLQAPVSGNVTTGLTETVMTGTPIFGSYTWTDNAVGQTRKWEIQGTQTRGTFSASYTIRLKVNGNTNVTWNLPASASLAVTDQLFTIEITQTRTQSNRLFYYMRFTSPESSTNQGYTLFTTLFDTAPIGTSGTYSITAQSSIASSTINFRHILVTSILS